MNVALFRESCGTADCRARLGFLLLLAELPEQLLHLCLLLLVDVKKATIIAGNVLKRINAYLGYVTNTHF